MTTWWCGGMANGIRNLEQGPTYRRRPDDFAKLTIGRTKREAPPDRQDHPRQQERDVEILARSFQLASHGVVRRTRFSSGAEARPRRLVEAMVADHRLADRARSPGLRLFSSDRQRWWSRNISPFPGRARAERTCMFSTGRPSRSWWHLSGSRLASWTNGA